MYTFKIVGLLAFLFFLGQIGLKTRKLHRNGLLNNMSGGGVGRWLKTFGLILFLSVYLLTLSCRTFHIVVPMVPEIITTPFINSTFLSITGMAFILVANLILYKSLSDLRNEMRFNLNEQNHGKLVTTGIFRYSRNPFFLSILILLSGPALMYPNLLFILTAILTFMIIPINIRQEEKFLEQLHGQEYLNYKTKTRRFL